MPSYTPADFSAIHPAEEAPKKIGWYITDHRLVSGTFDNIHKGTCLANNISFNYWDGNKWYTQYKEQMSFGAVGCINGDSILGCWFGLKEQPK